MHQHSYTAQLPSNGIAHGYVVIAAVYPELIQGQADE